VTAPTRTHVEAGPISALVVDDSPDIVALLRGLLEAEGHVVETAASGTAALGLLEEHVYDLVITDLKMSGPDGLEVLARARATSPATTVVIMTGYASLDTALRAIRGGAYDYITKPFGLDEIEVLLTNVADRIRLRREKALLERELEDAYRLIAHLQYRPAAGDPDRAAPGPPHPDPAPRETHGEAPQEASTDRRGEALAAYEAAAWTPERAAERLETLFRRGALSPDAYRRLTGLIPRKPTVA
jgi:CheY-like chemotaxis protein